MTKTPSSARWAATFSKQRTCSLLVEQVEERVVDDVDQPVGARDRHLGEVADRHRDGVAAGLLAELRDHVGREVDALDGDPAGRERKPDPAGADGELERRPVGGQPGEERHGVVLVTAKVSVVLLGRFAEEALYRVVVLHRSSRA